MKKLLRRGFGLALVLVLCTSLLLPLTVAAAEAPPEVVAESWLVMDADTGQVLVAGNPDKLEYPASITKILTLGLVLEQIDLTAEGHNFTEVSQAAIDALMPRASMIALQPGEQAMVVDLLYATSIESANDAANVLAEYVSGSMEEFTVLMNQKVAELGLTGSHFVNPSGQPDDNHYTTAYDMAVIMRWALGIPGFKELFTATDYSMAPTNKQPAGRQFHNRNMALAPYSNYYCAGVTASKTGYTDQARYTLATSARRGDTELICIALNSALNDGKYTTTNQLLDYCFANFHRVSYPLDGIDAGKVPVYGGGANALGEIDIVGSGEATFMLHNSLDANSVEMGFFVPEKYVLGQPFAPEVILSLPDGVAQQYPGRVAAVPLHWQGLEQILADNTTTVWEHMENAAPLWFWFAMFVLLAALGVLGRIAYVRHRRYKRRMRRLAAAQAQRPIRIAERPKNEPPKATGTPVRRPSTPGLRVIYNDTSATQPRRIGRAR